MQYESLNESVVYVWHMTQVSQVGAALGSITIGICYERKS